MPQRWPAWAIAFASRPRRANQLDRHQAAGRPRRPAYGTPVYVSTDLVFDGEKPWYTEIDCPTPLSVYGQSKATAERAVLDHARDLVLRISLLFGPAINGRPSFFEQQIQAVKNGTPCKLFSDEWRTPISLQCAAEGLLRLAAADVTGILHLGGPQRMSRLEMGQRLAQFLGRDEAMIEPCVCGMCRLLSVGRATRRSTPIAGSSCSRSWRGVGTRRRRADGGRVK